MDRISVLRNVEEALAAFEAGDADLAATEERVVTILRTYATDFEGDGGDVYRATGDDRVAGAVVVAGSPAEARATVRETLADAGVDVDDDAFSVERLG